MHTKKSINQISYEVVSCAIEVQKQLGPGLLESVYHKCMLYELDDSGLQFQSEVRVPLIYNGHKIDEGLRIDILVEDIIIVELKAVEKILPVHKAQLLSYMKLAAKPKGLLINF